MSSVLELLGIDPDELEWHDLAMCRGMDRELFYDDYEADEKVAQMTDEICLSCPVLQECLFSGMENNEYGTWGGIYLERGRPDPDRNRHKTEQTWEELRARVSDIL